MTLPTPPEESLQGQAKEKRALLNQEPVTVLGMQMGKPFTLPACSGTSDLDGMNSNYTCWTPTTIPNTKRVWYKGNVLIATQIYAQLYDGLLAMLELDTLGVKFQENTLSILKEKFGEPLRFEVVPYQNSVPIRLTPKSTRLGVGSLDARAVFAAAFWMLP